eukprot:3634535-Prymnesium_polylepis.3
MGGGSCVILGTAVATRTQGTQYGSKLRRARAEGCAAHVDDVHLAEHLGVVVLRKLDDDAAAQATHARARGEVVDEWSIGAGGRGRREKRPLDVRRNRRGTCGGTKEMRSSEDALWAQLHLQLHNSYITTAREYYLHTKGARCGWRVGVGRARAPGSRGATLG